MVKRIQVILISLSILTISCQNVTSTNTSNINKPNAQNNITNKYSITGSVDFSDYLNGKFNTKATLSEIGSDATVSLIYPSNHATKANKTVATGLTNSSGSFRINPDNNFIPNNNEIFILEAIKRIGSIGNNLLSIRTFIKFTGNNWDSITGTTIYINTQTTALSSMVSLMGSAVDPVDTIGTIIGSTPSDVNHGGNIVIRANSIKDVAGKLITFVLSKNIDPTHYLTYEYGKFTLKDPVSITNIISTVAGDGSWGYSGDDGQATSAQIYVPYEIAFDSNGNMYISDTGNRRIRKVDTSGVITTIAGNGTGGYSGDGSSATASSLNFPRGIEIDSNGNLYISDSNNNRIRKIHLEVSISP